MAAKDWVTLIWRDGDDPVVVGPMTEHDADRLQLAVEYGEEWDMNDPASFATTARVIDPVYRIEQFKTDYDKADEELAARGAYRERLRARLAEGK